MPTPTTGPRLGGSPAHQKLILANLASQLFEHGKITTTEAKAKRLRPLAERLITKAKRGDLHARRQVMRTIRDRSVVHELFTEIAPTFAERDGGYLRITKAGSRKGDNAPLAVIELVTESVEESKKANASDAKKESSKKTSAKKTSGKKASAKKATPGAAAAATAAEAAAGKSESGAAGESETGAAETIPGEAGASGEPATDPASPETSETIDSAEQESGDTAEQKLAAGPEHTGEEPED